MAGALAVIAAVVLINVLASRLAVVTALLVLGPLIAATAASVLQTAAVGALAIALAALSGLWIGWAQRFPIMLLVVVAGAVLATLLTATRQRTAHVLQRLRLLARLGAAAGTPGPVERGAERLLAVLVGDLADAAVIALAEEVAGPGGRVFVGAEQTELAAELRARCAASSRLSLTSPGPPALLISDLGAAAGHGSEPARETASLSALGLRSSIVVALRARERAVGELALHAGRSGRRYSRADLAFAEVVADRVAVALDNAHLANEIVSREEQLRGVLGAIDDAITVHDAAGNMLYINAAAAALVGARHVDEVLEAAPGELVNRFSNVDEQGRPIPPEAMPGRRALALGRPVSTVMRNVARSGGVEHWLNVKAMPIVDSRGRALAVNICEDITNVKRAEIEQRFLAQASHALAAMADHRQALRRIADLAVPQIADWCVVDLVGADGEVELAAVAHADPAKVALARQLRSRYPVRVGDSGLGEVVAGGATLLVQPIDDERIAREVTDRERLRMLREIDLGAVLIVAMRAGGEIIGALTFGNGRGREQFSQRTIELAEGLGARVGAAVVSSRLFEERTRIAHVLQAALLPTRLPALPGWQLDALYRAAGTATEVGGDFYDAFWIEGDLVVVVGDVVGKGPDAAALIALVRFSFRTAMGLTADLDEALAHVDEAMRSPDLQPLRMCSLVCVRVRPHGLVEVRCAGHPPPFLVGERARALDIHGPMLGALEHPRWPGCSLTVEPGESIVLYTDGVLDTRGTSGRFGERGLAGVLSAGPRPPGELLDALADALDQFAVGPQVDDTAVVVLHRRSGPPSEAAAMSGPVLADRRLWSRTTLPESAQRT